MKNFDIFGSQISLRFQGKPIHKTKFGAFFTFAMLTGIFVRLGIIISMKIHGEKPQMLFQERVSLDHTPFIITPQTFQIAFAIQNSSYNYIYNEKIFKIYGIQSKKVMKLNPDTNVFEPVWTSVNFSLEKCTKEHIVHPETEEFFNLSKIQDHYCLPKDMQLQIQGEFNSDVYQEIVLKFKRCSGPNCLPDKEIDALLNNHYIEALFTDIIIQPENKENPFKPYARDLFWSSSNQLPRTVNMYMRNNYLESDFGWFTQNLDTKIYPTFSYQDSQIVSTKSDSFFKFVFRFEKQKENYYKRSYQNAFEMISELGGFSQILLTACIFICTVYSQLHLSKAIIDETFNFHEYKDEMFEASTLKINSQINDNTLMRSSKGANKDKDFTTDPAEEQKQGKMNKSIFDKQNKNKNENETEMQQSIFSEKYNTQQTQQDTGPETNFINKISKMINQSKYYYSRSNSKKEQVEQQKPQQDDKQLKEAENEFKKLMDKTTNSMNFNIFSYFASFFCRRKQFVEKKKIIDYSIDTLYKHLDLQYIIKRLIEVEKLKRIILDTDQLNLFEVLPKPSIDYYFTKKSEVVINNKQNNLFYHDQRSDLEKTNSALQSLRNIIDKNKMSKIDSNIIKLIDERFQKVLQQTIQENDTKDTKKDITDDIFCSPENEEYYQNTLPANSPTMLCSKSPMQQSINLKSIDDQFKQYSPMIPRIQKKYFKNNNQFSEQNK